MQQDRVERFIELIRLYNAEVHKRVFRVDRDCYVVFTGFSSLNEKPFVRIGYSRYVEGLKRHISDVVVTAGYLSSIKREIEQIKSDEFETNFIVPSSIYSVILKFIPSALHHKVNVSVIDRPEEEEFSAVIKEISEKYRTYVILYSDGNFAVTFSGKKVFDLFSAVVNDLTTSKLINLFSAKFYDLLPNNIILRVGGNYVIRSKKGEILIATDEFDEEGFLKYPIPLTAVRTVVGNDVLSLIDTIRLVYDRSRLRVFTNRETYEDFRHFTLGIRFVEVCDRINLINNVAVTSSEGKYYIPLVDGEGNERRLVFGRGERGNVIRLENMEYVKLEDFSKDSLSYLSTDLLLRDPEDKGFEQEFDRIRRFFKEKFNKRVLLADVMEEVERDNSRIINDRRRLEELVGLYEEVLGLPYSERLELLIKIEKLEGSEKEKKIKEFAQKVTVEGATTVRRPSARKKVGGFRELKRPVFLGFGLKYLLVSLVVLAIVVGGLFISFRESILGIFGVRTLEESRVAEIMSELENTYEPKLTEFQKELGITITDYDIWVYVNKVAVINGYKPLTYRNPKKWEDPDWVYPGNKLKMVDETLVIVREGDNMWNISKRKLIEDYIRKRFVVTVESRAGTNVYNVRKK